MPKNIPLTLKCFNTRYLASCGNTTACVVPVKEQLHLDHVTAWSQCQLPCAIF